MTESPTSPNAEAQPIHDASAVLLVDARGPEPRLLMGLRRPENVFLPNKWVFPGGRLEAQDRTISALTEIDARDAEALSHRVAGDVAGWIARALALAAVRELYEETGHALALPAPEGARAGAVWPDVEKLGLWPTLAPLRFIARAITPPGRTRRYDTRFFLADRQSVVEGAGPVDGEFSDLNWFTFPEARDLDLPIITRRVLADLEEGLAAAHEARFAQVPFYYQEGNIYRRDLIPRG